MMIDYLYDCHDALWDVFVELIKVDAEIHQQQWQKIKEVHKKTNKGNLVICFIISQHFNVFRQFITRNLEYVLFNNIFDITFS